MVVVSFGPTLNSSIIYAVILPLGCIGGFHTILTGNGIPVEDTLGSIGAEGAVEDKKNQYAIIIGIIIILIVCESTVASMTR